VTARTIQDGPFAWQGKATLRRIADACDGRKDRALILALYTAMTWLASDKQAESFTETITRIGERAGVSYRKTAGVLSFLSRLGVVEIRENLIDGTKERGPNTYTLGTVCATSGTECLRLGTGENRSVPRLLEESLEQAFEHTAPVGVLFTEPPAEKTAKPRRPNRELEALVALDGSDLTQATQPAWSRAAKALKNIRAVCPLVTVDEICRRSANYRAHMPTVALTASALAANWAKCDHGPALRGTSGRPEASVRRVDLSCAPTGGEAA
jgi:hypothetical protein